jgi:hypothetical protein
MFSSTTALCTKALIRKMEKLNMPIQCIVSENIEYDLIEIHTTSDMIYTIHDFEWLKEFDNIVERHTNAILTEDLRVVVPIGITFHDLDGPEVGHAIIGILSKKDDESILFQICDGNGFIKSWHRPFMSTIKRYYSECSPKVVPSFDKSQPAVNHIESKEVKQHLKSVGITYPKLDGQCAFLAYVYTVDQLCTGITTKGHGLRLFQDLLQKDDDDTEEEPWELKPWELAIVSAYVMATAYKVVQIMVEFYPTKEDAIKEGWDPRLDYPNLAAIKPIHISKHRAAKNLLKLVRKRGE